MKHSAFSRDSSSLSVSVCRSLSQVRDRAAGGNEFANKTYSSLVDAVSWRLNVHYNIFGLYDTHVRTYKYTWIILRRIIYAPMRFSIYILSQIVKNKGKNAYLATIIYMYACRVVGSYFTIAEDLFKFCFLFGTFLHNLSSWRLSTTVVFNLQPR